jgi:SAM-dependent methyltransferase
MREEKINRFNNFALINRRDLYYLVYTYLIKTLYYAVEKYATGNVLDIGCGNKPYFKMFEGKIEKYVGCDIIQSSENKVDILCPANKIPITDGSFETVFSTQTIEHVEDHQGLVNEAYRLLKRGGHFIVSGPLYWHLHEEPYDFFRFTNHGFKYILEKAGFEVIEILPNGGSWATTGQAIIHSCSFHNPQCNWFIKILKKVFFKLRIYVLVNWFFEWLDKKDYNPVNTMNYVVVAKKK